MNAEQTLFIRYKLYNEVINVVGNLIISLNEWHEFTSCDLVVYHLVPRYLGIYHQWRGQVSRTDYRCSALLLYYIILELKFYLTWVALILSFSFHLCGGVILLPYFIDFRAESLPNSTKLCIKDPRLVQIFLIDIYKVDIYLPS